MKIQLETVEKTPITSDTISDSLLAKIANNFNVDLKAYDTNELKNGIIRELESMQTYTAQALSAEKLNKAFEKTYSNINQNPSYYTNNPSLAYSQDKFKLQERFQFNDFKKMKPREQYQFLHSLPDKAKVGLGSSRNVFILGNGKVIKFATNKGGIEQNKEEIKNYKKTNSVLLPKIYDYSPIFQWIMAELVYPFAPEMKNAKAAAQEFEQKSGFNFDSFVGSLEDHLMGEEIHQRYLKSDIFQELIKLVKTTNLSIGDVAAIYNWGQAADGRLVLLDAGLSQEHSDKLDNPKKFTDSLRPPASFSESLKLKNVYRKELFLEKKFFDIENFKQLPPIKQVLFLNQKGKKIGEGSSRKVFLIDGKTVLKLARDEKGLAQNKAEVEAFQNPEITKLVTRVYDFSPDYRWLISEIARTINTEEEFTELLGADYDVFFNELEKHVKSFRNGKPVDTDNVHNPLLGLLVDLVQKHGYQPGDFYKLDSWGKTADGRLVLLDSGFTDQVYQTHYKSREQLVSSRASADSKIKTAVPGQTKNSDHTNSNKTNSNKVNTAQTNKDDDFSKTASPKTVKARQMP